MLSYSRMFISRKLYNLLIIKYEYLSIKECAVIYHQSWQEVTQMKKDIHPKYNTAVIRCACGETFETRSTKSEIRVEICSKCHPYFTGKQKLIDSGGRVDRFNKRLGLANK